MPGVSHENTDLVPVVRQFDEFYAVEYRKVLAVAYALSGNWSSAEDVTQEAFLRAHSQWSRVGAFDYPEAWVRKVASNLAVSLWRRRTAEARALLRLGSQPSEHDLSIDAEEFWAAVRRLPRRQSQVVALHYLDELTVDEIAVLLDMAPSTVRVQLHNARKRLAVQLQPSEAR